MQFKNAWQTVLDSQKYQDWKQEHQETTFSYAFTTVEKEISKDWQIGFYDKNEDKITTFSILNGEVVDYRTDEVFKQPGSQMLEIELTKVKLSIDEILKLVDEFIKKEYSNEIVNRKIMILQNLPGLGTIWNITLISLTFNSINIKISADTGDIKEHKLSSLKDFMSNKPF